MTHDDLAASVGRALGGIALACLLLPGAAQARADLSVAIQDSPDPVRVETTLTYALAVTNAGPDPAVGAVLRASLGDKAVVLRASTTRGRCSAGPTTTCELGTLNPGAVAALVVDLRPTQPGRLTSTAQVRDSAGDDPQPANDSDVAETYARRVLGPCPNRLFGTLRADELDGTADSDAIFGRAGSDVLLGAANDDCLSGQRGHDRLTGASGHDLIYGGPKEDLLLGDSGDDRLAGGAGVDVQDGSQGEDVLRGDAGGDLLAGGDGEDWIAGDPGNDEIWGESGDDHGSGGSGNDVIEGDRGADRLAGGEGVDTVEGETGADELRGGDGSDDLDGGEGGDTLHGGMGVDRLDGGEGADALEGGRGIDSVIGGEGADRIEGAETVEAGDGDDTVYADVATVNCGPGLDTAFLRGASRLTNCERVFLLTPDARVITPSPGSGGGAPPAAPPPPSAGGRAPSRQRRGRKRGCRRRYCLPGGRTARVASLQLLPVDLDDLRGVGPGPAR